MCTRHLSLISSGLVLLALGAAPGAGAQQPPRMEPGLWEMTLGGDLDKMLAGQQAGLQAEMAGLPPERQAQMRAMMDGILEKMRGPSRRCVSAQQAASTFDEMGNAGIARNCRRTITWTSKTRAQIAGTCPDGSTEDGHILVSENHRSLGMRTTLSRPGAEPLTLTAESRWLGADCKSKAH